MRYLHTMLRVRDLDAALDFFVAKLGLREQRRQQNEAGRFTLVFLATGTEGDGGEIELTYNWDQSEPYPTGRFFGHLAYEVDDLYATCERLRAAGVDILRPPRDGHMAFINRPTATRSSCCSAARRCRARSRGRRCPTRGPGRPGGGRAVARALPARHRHA